MSTYTEDHLVEQPAIQLMQHEMGWDVVNCYDEWSGGLSNQGRDGKREVVLVSLLEYDPDKVAAKFVEALGERKHAFTQWFGAFLRQPYALPVLTTVYVEDFPDEGLLKNELRARRVDGGGRLRIVKPKDEGVFLCPQKIRGRQVVCDVQIYLDVIRAGLRGDEAALELKGMENFSGGWK